MEALISAKSLLLGYHSRAIGSPSSFEIPHGERVALIGANGSGKSTLLKAILGERCLVGGEFEINGARAKDLTPKDISTLFSYVGQEHLYVSEIRVRDFLRLAALARTQMFRSLPELSSGEIEKVSALGVATFLDRTLGSLSTGERQRIFLARAVLQGAQCLILDEPTNHLDPPGVFEFWEMLSKVGTQCIVSTHDLGFVKGHATWVCVMANGEVVYSGKTESLWSGDVLRKAYGNKWFSANVSGSNPIQN